MPSGLGFELQIVSTQWSTALRPVESQTFCGVVCVRAESLERFVSEWYCFYELS